MSARATHVSRSVLRTPTLPAMTLIEMLVGLSILGLAMGFALAVLGPWLMESRRADREAAFQRSLEPAQLILAELTAGIVDPKETLQIELERARFRVFAPRLAPAPFDAELAIVADAHAATEAGDASERSALLLRASVLDPHESRLLEDAPPLRFRAAPSTEENGAASAIVLEARQAGEWAPLLIAPIATDAPLHCEFDFIARACR